MKFEKYLNDEYVNLLYDNYEDYYIESIDEDNFDEVYNLLKKYKFTCIKDLIVYYLEAFDMDAKYIESALQDMKEILGTSYQDKISKDLTLFNEVIKKAIYYSEEEI